MRQRNIGATGDSAKPLLDKVDPDNVEPDKNGFYPAEKEDANYVFTKYDLDSIDALDMRLRDLTLNEHRILKLDLKKVQCMGLRYCARTKKQKKCGEKTYVRGFIDYTHTATITQCRACTRCLQCKQYPGRNQGRIVRDEAEIEAAKHSERCFCTYMDGPTKRFKRVSSPTLGRVAARVVWYYLTIRGLLVTVYTLMMRNMFQTVLFAYVISLLQRELDVVTTASAIGADLWENITTWLYTLTVVVLLACFLLLIKKAEALYTIESRTTRRRLNRLRFEQLEARDYVLEEHASSFANLYYSDDEREGYSDPDVAYMNFSMPDRRVLYRRYRRLFCAHAF